MTSIHIVHWLSAYIVFMGSPLLYIGLASSSLSFWKEYEAIRTIKQHKNYMTELQVKYLATFLQSFTPSNIYQIFWRHERSI